MNPFHNKIAIVTGGASGIGKGLCQRLAQAGATVIVADINGDGAEQVAAAIGAPAQAAQIDVSDAAAVEALVQQTVATHGRLDYIFNNAGVCYVGETLDMSMEQWRRIVDVNLLGVVYGTMAAYRVMVQQGHGHIVNSASLAGLSGFAAFTCYSTTKAAVAKFSELLRLEAAGYGVNVTAIAPGFIQSGIYDHSGYNRLSRADADGLIPFNLLPVESAVTQILDGVRRNQGAVIFPTYGKILWWLQRLSPSLLAPIHRKTINDLRKAKQHSF